MFINTLLIKVAIALDFGIQTKIVDVGVSHTSKTKYLVNFPNKLF